MTLSARRGDSAIPRIGQSYGDRGLDEEIDRLWRMNHQLTSELAELRLLIGKSAQSVSNTVTPAGVQPAPIVVPVDAVESFFVVGMDGEPGESGSPGPPGVAGAAGATGADGAAGVAGAVIPGMDGQDGEQGPPGVTAPLPPGAITAVFDGGSAVPAASTRARVYIPFACTIIQAVIEANASGSAVVDVWALAGATSVPAVGNTITASAKPTLSSQQAVSDITLTGWTKSIAAGTWIVFNLDSASTVNQVTCTLIVQK